MLNYLNSLSPGQAQEWFANNPQWQSIFSQMNSPEFQNTLTGYLNNLNQFFDLLNRFRDDLDSGGTVTPDSLFYDFHMAANVTSIGQIDSYLKQLRMQIERFRTFAQEARPGSSGHLHSLNQFNLRMARFLDQLGRASGINFTPSQLADYIRAIINGDQNAMEQILRSSPWVQQMEQQLGNLSTQQLQDLLNRLNAAQSSTEMYMALSAVLGIAVAAMIIAYLYNYFSEDVQQSGGYSPNP